MTTRTSTAFVVVSFAVLTHAAGVGAQGWSADVSAGRLVYDAVAATVGTNNLIGSLRYDTATGTWVYGAAAAPFGEGGTRWGGGGAGGRVMVPSQTGVASIGADMGAHAYSFRDRVATLSGTGATVEAMPFVRVAVGEGFVEGRGGWRGQTLSFAGVRENRGVFETGARGGYGTIVRVEGDARWVHATEGAYPFVGATVAYTGSRVDLWGEVGRWVATDLDERVWSVGTAVSVGPRTMVWGSVRQEAPDPLYWNLTRRAWSVGLTQRLGRVAAPLVPVPRSPAGTVLVRLSAADAPAGAVAIGGDFNNWQPAPMQREGDDWVVRLPLAPGVYNYAFRSASGEWFVPPSTAGRRDDGFGGYVAVLVVS